nr:MAG TPA: hypothetical protein [Caudoviricetes sp.]
MLRRLSLKICHFLFYFCYVNNLSAMACYAPILIMI